MTIPLHIIGGARGLALHRMMRDAAPHWESLSDGDKLQLIAEASVVLQGAQMTQDKWMRPGLDFARGKMIEELGELQEKMGDLAAALGKSLRWGWESVNPDLPVEKRESNVAWARRAMGPIKIEIADVLTAIDNLEKELDKIY